MLKIAFLFLTVANIAHETHWQDFFSGHEEHYSVYIHAKNPLSSSSLFKKHELPNTVHTTWSHTMKAQIELLRIALQDPDNEKFIFISELTIPLQDFDHVYRSLMSHDASMFYYFPNPHVNRNNTWYWPQAHRNVKPIPTEKQFKNSQWVILSRKHAQMMVDDTEYIEIISKNESDQEHYPSTFLLARGELDSIIPVDTTYVEWNHGDRPPFQFTDFNDAQQMKLIKQAQEHGYLFARKIMPDCVLAPLNALLPYTKKTPTTVTAIANQKTTWHADTARAYDMLPAHTAQKSAAAVSAIKRVKAEAQPAFKRATIGDHDYQDGAIQFKDMRAVKDFYNTH